MDGNKKHVMKGYAHLFPLLDKYILRDVRVHSTSIVDERNGDGRVALHHYHRRYKEISFRFAINTTHW